MTENGPEDDENLGPRLKLARQVCSIIILSDRDTDERVKGEIHGFLFVSVL